MGDALRVVLVDDQELIRTGFALILGTEPDIEVVGEAGDGAEAVQRVAALVASGSAPDVVLMDVRMPGTNGIEATAELARSHPEVRILVLTTFDLDEYAVDAIKAGASGFLLKDARAAELIQAVRAVASGDVVLAPSVTKRLLLRLREGSGSTGSRVNVAGPDRVALPTPSPPASGAEAASVERQGHSPEERPGHPAAVAALAQLTEREREVFAAVAQGLSNAEIGEQLFLSESTVKTHVGRIFAKLALRDRVHAVILAYELGLR